MSGVAVIWAKLVAYAALTDIVDAAKIKAGTLPIDTRPPAIGVTLIGGTQDRYLKRTATGNLHTDTVRVSWIVADEKVAGSNITGYPALRAISAAVLAACPETRGTVAGIKVDSIHPAGEGPDLPTDAPAWLSGSRDFLVRWSD